MAKIVAVNNDAKGDACGVRTLAGAADKSDIRYLK